MYFRNKDNKLGVVIQMFTGGYYEKNKHGTVKYPDKSLNKYEIGINPILLLEYK